MNLQLIRDLSAGRVGGIRQLAIDAGMSEANLHRCIRNNKIQAGDLENLAKVLGVEIALFFDETPPNKGNHYSTPQSGSKRTAWASAAILEEQLKSAKQIIELKDKIIEEKERTISLILGNSS